MLSTLITFRAVAIWPGPAAVEACSIQKASSRVIQSSCLPGRKSNVRGWDRTARSKASSRSGPPPSFRSCLHPGPGISGSLPQAFSCCATKSGNMRSQDGGRLEAGIQDPSHPPRLFVKQGHLATVHLLRHLQQRRVRGCGGSRDTAVPEGESDPEVHPVELRLPLSGLEAEPSELEAGEPEAVDESVLRELSTPESGGPSRGELGSWPRERGLRQGARAGGVPGAPSPPGRKRARA